MSSLKIEDLRFSSSSMDDFLSSKSYPEPRLASSGGKIRVSSLRQIEGAGFSFVSNDKLVRLSQNDFWKLGEDEDGSYIERLVSDDNGPVKG